MNSKLLFVLFFLISSCGVKAPPTSDTKVPSIIDIHKKEMSNSLKDKDDLKKKNKKKN